MAPAAAVALAVIVAEVEAPMAEEAGEAEVYEEDQVQGARQEHEQEQAAGKVGDVVEVLQNSDDVTLGIRGPTQRSWSNA
eukprot:COSAG02_NODE_15865_length_1135_cov_1.056950_1_plen_80_part_00